MSAAFVVGMPISVSNGDPGHSVSNGETVVAIFLIPRTYCF